jgi:hypothetical protein
LQPAATLIEKESIAESVALNVAILLRLTAPRSLRE